jgi:deoxyhypusine synthase
MAKNDKNDNEKKARTNLLRKSEEVEGLSIRGYDFDKGVDWERIIDSFASTGFQATQFGKAIEIIKEMREEGAFIYLGFTSNMVSSGLRDIFRYLVKNKMVNFVVTTAGGIEEDIIKCLGDFKMGDFRANGGDLRKKGINRIGNIFVPNNRYVDFESFVQPILEELYQRQKRSGKVITSSELIWTLGERINDEKSIYFWAYKNKIPIHCPAIGDGALGDNIYFFKFKHPDFSIDLTQDIKIINDTTIGLSKSGMIILGSGVVKHAILNANMLRNGADYSVYINNSQEFDGSDAGADPSEAISWGKIRPAAKSVKVFGDATILFPILVAKTFAKK